MSHVCANMSHVLANMSHVSAKMSHVCANISHLCANLSHVRANMSHVWANMSHVRANMSHVCANMSHVRANMSHVGAKIIATNLSTCLFRWNQNPGTQVLQFSAKKKFFCKNSFALLRELLLKNKFSRCVLNCTSHRRNKVTSFKKFLYPYSRRLSCAYVLKSTEGKNNKERWAKCTISLKGQSDEKSTATRRRLSHPQKKYKNKIYYIL